MSSAKFRLAGLSLLMSAACVHAQAPAAPGITPPSAAQIAPAAPSNPGPNAQILGSGPASGVTPDTFRRLEMLEAEIAIRSAQKRLSDLEKGVGPSTPATGAPGGSPTPNGVGAGASYAPSFTISPAASQNGFRVVSTIGQGGKWLAQIVSGDGQQHFAARVGDPLTDGWKVASIDDNAVVILRKNKGRTQKKTLELTYDATSGMASLQSAMSALAAAGPANAGDSRSMPTTSPVMPPMPPMPPMPGQQMPR